MDKIIQTPQQRANTVEALEVLWPSVPEANVSRDLRCFRDDGRNTAPTCNTVCCFGGWVGWYPPFRKQGVRSRESMPAIGDAFGCRVAEILFGDIELFMCRGGHPADRRFTGTDKALVTNRLRWLLENSEVRDV